MSSREATEGARWLLNRLRCMSPAEILHRAVQATALKSKEGPALQAVDAGFPGQFWMKTPAHMSAQPYVEEAESISLGSVRLFSHQRFTVGGSPQWNRCPLTGVEAPSVPAARLSITNRQLVGDIKYVWELNRHLQLVTLAQAWRLTRKPEYLHTLRRQLSGWLDQCPVGIGPNWCSSLELGIRLINWAVVWQLLDGDSSVLFDGPEGSGLRERWLASIQHHVLRVARNYSRYSSANNHLIGELAGVYVASRTWPVWPKVRALGDIAWIELQQQAVMQTSADGVNREQAFAYQGFVAEFLTVSVVVALHSADVIAPSFTDRLAAMMCFVAAVRTNTGVMPRVGDADDAEVLRLDPRVSSDRFGSMLQTGGALFARADWLLHAEPSAGHARWLVSPRAAGALNSTRQQLLDYPDGGYFLFDAPEAGPLPAVKGLIDVGPLGYLGIAAHGHADALQVWLSVDGHELLIDPGTYGYWFEKSWRDYFRGTSAHNTVRIDGVDQSESGGRFMWLRKARSAVEAIERTPAGDLQLSAQHDGYRRLPGRFMHTRRVQFESQARRLTVTDQVQGSQPGVIELFWHLAPEWQIQRETNDCWLIANDSVSIRLRIEADRSGLSNCIQGQTEPPLGWSSERYGDKQSSACIRWAARDAQPALKMVTTIEITRRPIVLPNQS